MCVLVAQINYLNALNIKVQPGDWGNVKTEEIKVVLESTARVFLSYSTVLKNKKISVYKTSAAPKIYYKKLKSGAYRINISAKSRFWCQYAFQFAHELGHLICQTRSGDSSNNWFEESICEAASLFALEKMADSWKNSPPYSNWKSYGIEFKRYRMDRIKNSAYPENLDLSSWWRQNRSLLSKNSNLRKQNLWVALEILPLIEKNPKIAWGTFECLNDSKNKNKKSFRKYLSDWKTACPDKEQKEFVQQIMNLFDIK